MNRHKNNTEIYRRIVGLFFFDQQTTDVWSSKIHLDKWQAEPTDLLTFCLFALFNQIRGKRVKAALWLYFWWTLWCEWNSTNKACGMKRRQCGFLWNLWVVFCARSHRVCVLMQLLWLVVIQMQEMVRFTVMVGWCLCLCSEAGDALRC